MEKPVSTIEPPRPDDDPSQPHRPATPSGMPPMPQYPQAPPPPPGMHPYAAVSLPRSMHTAVQLMYVGAVLSLLSLVMSLTTLGSLKSQLRDRLEEDGRDVSEAVVNAGYRFAITFTAIAGIIAIALWLWMARKNGQGRQWARIVATVLGAINVISTIFSIVSGNTTLIASIITVVNLALAIVILVLLWRKESSNFYAAQARYPGQPY